MKVGIWSLAAAAAIAGLAVLAWQITSGESEQVVELPPTPLPTTTPSVSTALSVEEALSQLQQVPHVSDLVKAIGASDVDGFLALISWQPYPCGVRNSVRCPAGVEAGTDLDMVNIDHTFWVTAERLRPVIRRILAGGALPLTFASQSYLTPDGEAGDFYFLGYEGGVSDAGLPQLPGFPTGLTGFFLMLDASSGTPVLTLDWLGAAWTASDQVREGVVLNLSQHEIITGRLNSRSPNASRPHMVEPIAAEGPRVILRPVGVEDAALFAKWRSDLDQLPRWAGSRRVLSPAELAADFDRMLAGNMTLIAVSKRTLESFGFVQAYNFAPDLGWAYLLVYYDPGARTPATSLEATYLFGEYLFSAFPLRKLDAEIFEYNDDVLAQLARVGWKEEGRFREHIWYRDRYWALVRVALFREQWNQHREHVKFLVDGQHGLDTYYGASTAPGRS